MGGPLLIQNSVRRKCEDVLLVIRISSTGFAEESPHLPGAPSPPPLPGAPPPSQGSAFAPALVEITEGIAEGGVRTTIGNGLVSFVGTIPRCLHLSLAIFMLFSSRFVAE